MRDRYYVRFERILTPWTNALDEFNHHCWELRKQWRVDNPDSMTGPPVYNTDENRAAWFLEKHNIVLSKNANGILKLGFASEEDVTLFALRMS